MKILSWKFGKEAEAFVKSRPEEEPSLFDNEPEDTPA
jgi:hypothetical protein